MLLQFLVGDVVCVWSAQDEVMYSFSSWLVMWSVYGVHKMRLCTPSVLGWLCGLCMECTR